MWIYQKAEKNGKGFYEVGVLRSFGGTQDFIAVETYDTATQARDAVHYLNGGESIWRSPYAH